MQEKELFVALGVNNEHIKTIWIWNFCNVLNVYGEYDYSDTRTK